MKALRAEYASLLKRKKNAYADYQKRREEMKELLTAKANVDRILGLEEKTARSTQKEKRETDVR